MANEIKCPFDTGADLYVVLLDEAGQVWNGTAFEALNGAHWTTYAIPLVEQGASGIYLGNFPTGLAYGKYGLIAYQQTGAAPAVAPADHIRGVRDVVWTGTLEYVADFGSGTTAITSDFGGVANSLTYETANATPIPGATVTAYLTSDYAAGRTGSGYIQGRTVTDRQGRMVRPLMLTPGSYTLLFERPGEEGPDVQAITVT